MEEAGKLAESTAILLNVSEFQDATDASEALISTMQAFKYTADDSQHVVDILNEIGNNYAVSSDGLAIALQDSASALMEAGNNLEQSVALVAAANKVLQDPNSVGSALRTISLRLRGTSVEVLEELGEETDGAVESVSKMQEKLKALTGVDILTDSGAYKDTYTILKEIAEVWDTMDPMNQAAALELMAGKNRANALAAILGNIEDLKYAYEDALNAEGSAMRENERYLESVQGHIDTFNNSLQTMWMNFLDTDAVKWFVHLGDAVIKLVDKFGVLQTVVAGFLTYLNLSSNSKFDLASMLGIHELEESFTKGFSIVGKEGLTGSIVKSFNKFFKKNKKETIEVPISIEPEVEQIDMFSDEYISNIQLNNKLAELHKAQDELKKLKSTKFKDVQIPDDALEYKGAPKGYLNKVLIPNKEAEIKAIEKDINDITNAAKNVIKNNFVELESGQLKIGLDDFIDTESISSTNLNDVFANFGLSGLDKLSGKKIDFSDFEVAAKQIDGFNAALGQGQTAFLNYLPKLNNADASLQAYLASLDGGQASLQGFKSFISKHNAGLKASGIAAKAAAVGHQLLNAALSMGITMLASWTIDLVVKGLDKMITTTEEAAEAAEDAVTKYKSAQSELKNVDSTISEIADDYKKLALGVDEFGNNINLTTAEYERYNQIVNQIADMFPEMVRGYTDEGNAIIKNKGNVEQLTEAYKALKEEANNEILNNADNIMRTYKANIDGDFWSWDNSTSESVSASKLLDKIAREQDTFDFKKFNSEYRDQEYDTILGLLNDAGISREKSETNDEYVKRAVSEFPGIVQSIVNSWNSVVDSAVSNVKPLVSAYLDTSIGYESLTDAQKSVFESIASAFDSNFFSQFDGDASKMYQTIENMILNLKSSGIDDEYTLILNAKTQFNNDEVTIGDYKKQVQEFVSQIEGLQEQGFLDENSAQYIKMSLGFDLDGNSEYDAYINRAKKILQDNYDDMTSELTLSDLQIIDQLDIPDGTVLTWDQLRQKIAEVKRELNSDVTSVQTYSELSTAVESYNEVLSQTSEIVSDNTEVTQEYKDSLKSLGLSEEELADCFDENNKLIVKNAALLNKLVKQKKQDKKATVQQAKAYGQLQYKTTINQIGQLVNKMAAEVKATGYVSLATLKNINILRQQLTTIKETIQQYALLELSLSNAAQAYDDFAAAKERDAKLIYGDAMVDALNVLNEGFKTGQVGSEAFQYAVKLIVPPEVYENIDDIQKRMDAIHDYVDSNPIFADWFTIDEGQISITMDNIKAFIQDGLNGVDGRKPVFIGTLEDFDLSNSINSIEEFAAALGTTEAVALAMLTEFEKYDASWGNIVDRLTTSPLDRAINDTTTALEEAINAQEKFIRDGNQLYDEHGNNTAEYQKIVDGVTDAYEALGAATKAAVDNAAAVTQIETLLQGVTGELKLSQEQADHLARSLGLIGEGQSVTIENGAIKLTQDQIDILNAKLDLLEDPTVLDIQLASDEIDRQIQGLQNKDNDVLVELELADASEADIQAKIDALTATQKAIELVYDIKPSGEQNDSNLEKLGEWETNGVNITVRADITQFDADMEKVNAAETPEKEVPITTTSEEANREIDTVTNNNPPDKTVNLAMAGIQAAIDEVGALQGVLDSLNGTSTHTVYINYQNQNGSLPTGYADGTFHISGPAFASGNVGATKTETSLVGELGPELIVDPSTGRWHTVGDHGAEFTQVKKGQIIFNHLQTKQLLENGYVTSRGRLQGGGHAFASGTAYGYGTYDKYTGKDDAFKNGSNNSASSSKSNENSGNDASDNIADKVEEVVDFIEMKLEEIEKKIEKTSNKIVNLLDDTTSIKKKDKYYDALVKGEKDKASTYSKAAQKYNVEAEAALSGVPKKYQAMARNGAIAIKDFVGEDQVEVAEAIQKYRDWKAKADEAENKYLESIAAIAAYRVEQLEDISSDFENIISIYKSHSDLLQSQMDLVEESGNRLSANYYEELKKNSQSQLDNLKNQRAAMQKVLDDAVASGDIAVGSDEWYTMVNAITAVDKKIVDCKTDIEKYQNAINDLHWQNFDKFIDEIENVESELSNLYSLISDADKIVDDKGNWTNEGITSLGLLAQQMETAQFKAQQYGEAIDKLKQDYAKGLYSTDEYNKKLAELTEGQHDAIKSYEDAKDAIVNLNKTRAEAAKKYMQDEIDKYGELIEKKKESLNADKESRDFEKSIQESNKNIKDIERQIAALQGNTSSSAIAQRKRLEAELLKAREELQDKYYDHSIDKQQEALDKELEDYTKNKQEQMDALDEYLKKEEQVISDSFNLVAKNAKIVADTLTKISEEYGVSISSTIANPWINGTNAIGKYEEQLNTSVSATTKNLDTIKKHLEDLQAQADKTANSIIKATHTTVSKTTGGNQTSTKGYAKGSKSVEYDQWAIIDELGEELQIVPGENGRLEYIKKGTGILNSTLTERLMNLAMDPTSMIENSRPIIGAHGMTTNNNAIQIDNSVGTLLHVEHLDGSNPAEVAKLVDKAWEKKMQTLNNSIKKFTR